MSCLDRDLTLGAMCYTHNIHLSPFYSPSLLGCCQFQHQVYTYLQVRRWTVSVVQAANRVNFNQPDEEILDGDDVVGLGVLGKEGSGRLRAQVSTSHPQRYCIYKSI